MVSINSIKLTRELDMPYLMLLPRYYGFTYHITKEHPIIESPGESFVLKFKHKHEAEAMLDIYEKLTSPNNVFHVDFDSNEDVHLLKVFHTGPYVDADRQLELGLVSLNGRDEHVVILNFPTSPELLDEDNNLTLRMFMHPHGRRGMHPDSLNPNTSWVLVAVVDTEKMTMYEGLLAHVNTPDFREYIMEHWIGRP